jgi:hypothetical protein
MIKQKTVNLFFITLLLILQFIPYSCYVQTGIKTNDNTTTETKSNPYQDGRILKILESIETGLNDPSNNPGPVKIRIKLSKAYDEIDWFRVIIYSPTKINNNSGVSFTIYLDYNDVSGFFEGAFNFQNYHDIGIWKIGEIYIGDNDNNRWKYSMDEKNKTYYKIDYYDDYNMMDYTDIITDFLIDNGVNIVSNNSDTICPIINSIELTPNAIGGKGLVTIKINVIENGSGVNNCSGGILNVIDNNFIFIGLSVVIIFPIVVI